MSTTDLTRLRPDPERGNPVRVQGLETLAAHLDDSVPVVLLPVRIETRFVTVDVPVDGPPPTLLDLRDLLQTAARALARIAKADLRTSLTGLTGAARRDLRTGTEAPLYDLLARRLGDAQEALEQARVLQRDSLVDDKDGEGAKAAQETAGALRAALKGAVESIGTLRSDFQRERFTTQAQAVAALTAAVLDTLHERTLPAVALRAALHAPTVGDVVARREDERRRRLGGPAGADRDGVGDGATVAPRVLRATPAEARTVANAPVTLSYARLAAGAAAFTAVREHLRTVGDDPVTIAAIAASASTIPLLDAASKRDLLDAVARLAARAPAGDLDALRMAIRGIRSDDALLDVDVARPDLTVVLAPPTRAQDRLVVRVYPDDIHVDTHEEDLTAAERAAGIAFWTQTVAVGADAQAQRAAWRALCLGRPTRRAAWIAQALRPRRTRVTAGAKAAVKAVSAMDAFQTALRAVDETAQGGRLPALAKAAAALRTALGPATRRLPAAAIATLRERFAVAQTTAARLLARRPLPTLDPAIAKAARALDRDVTRIIARLQTLQEEPPQPLVFPAAGLTGKDGAWTRAATSPVLPSRFVVVAVAGGQVAHVVAGGPVDPALKLSIDPDPAAGEQFTLDAHGELTVGTSIRWMIDPDEAHARGMAITLDITPQEAQTGFDRIYVLGLRDDPARAAGGASALEELLDSHHYGHSGLELVAVGTPTNNTEGAPSGRSTDDDPDAAFDRERGAPFVSAAAPVDAQAPDGLRLARALGVDPGRLAHVAGAAGRGSAEALTAGRALHAATIGGWLQDQAAPLIPRGARERLRTFATQHVAARGLVPAFRVGAQPYGVLPVTAWSTFAPEPRDALPAGSPRLVQDAQQTFDTTLKAVLDTMLADWQAVREEHVRTATDPPTLSGARAHFLQVLGLEPVSTGGAYRFAVNVAGRHGPPSLPGDLRFGLPQATTGASPTGAANGPYALLERFDGVLRAAFGVTSTAPLRDPATGFVHADVAAIYETLQACRAYELRLLAKAHPLRGAFAGATPQAALTALLNQDPAQYVDDALHGRPNASLATLLARHAHLLELRDAALSLLVGEGFLTEADLVAIGSSGQFLTGSDAAALTGWSYLLQGLDSLDGEHAAFPAHPLRAHLAGGALVDFLKVGGTAAASGLPAAAYAAPVTAHRADLATLTTLSAERLAVLVGEQLDLAGPRLDAWITGFAQRRLASMRTALPRGAHVGAYGWVEDLCPDAGHPLAAHVPAALAGDPSRPVHRDPESQGFVHAPSVNHAVTAAILRSGYLSQHAQPDVENRMAVNLSSRRTRLALSIIDGVRAGNTLGALLGYRLERFLHEFHDTGGPGAPTLDALIGPLRQAYPSVAGVELALSADVKARHVCDGLAIVDAVQGWIAAHVATDPGGATVAEILRARRQVGAHPWGLTAVPGLTDARLDGFILAVDHVADALDAVADLVLAEAVHQLALGNHPRAAAVLTALAEGKAPPRPEVVDTPRTGTPLVHRILLSLPDAGALPAAWAAIATTPRGAAEPALNAWLASLLGDPADLRVRLVRTGDGSDAGDVSVAALGLQALDLVAILGPGLETGLGELASRVLDARRPNDITDPIVPEPLQVDLGRAPAWSPAVRSIFALAPLLEALGGLVGRARAATAHDYVLGVPGAAGGPDGVDGVDLTARVTAARAALTDAGVALARLLADDAGLGPAVLDGNPQAFLDASLSDTLPSWGMRELWRAALLRAAAFGITAALPPAHFLGRVPVRQQLQAAAQTAFVELVTRRQAADRHLAGTPTTRDLIAAATACFGEAFVLVPRAALSNDAEVRGALAARLAPPSAIDGWLQGAGMVRDGAGGLSDVLALADAADAPAPGAAVAQLPHDAAAPEPWLGGRLPPGSQPAGRLSLAVFGPLGAAGAAGAALLVDEWTEILPAAAETTGVAVHYDQPDASPPQCVLVAVPPVRQGTWRLGDLVQTLHDTFELAQIRAVELEQLAPTLYGQLLPAVSGELVPDAVPDAAVPGDRVILDFGAFA